MLKHHVLFTFVKSSPLKFKFLRLLSARVNICETFYGNFQTTSQFLFRLFIIFQCYFIQLRYKFSVHAFSTFEKMILSKSQFSQFIKVPRALVKICKVLHIIFQTKSQVFYKFCMSFRAVKYKSSILFYVKCYILCTRRTN